MAKKPEFAHLHVHTEYSLLDGACRVDKLANRVAELGMDSIAVTDHGVMTGLYKLQQAADKAGIKPIFGIELYFTEEREVKDSANRYYHLTALAETTEGLHNLYKMNLRAAQEGMYYGKPRVDYELLKEYGEGVIVLSGCLAGRTMQSLANADLQPDPKKRMHEARDELMRLTDCVGKDNVYVEVQNSGVHDWDGNQWEWNGQLKTLADDLGLITVGTSDTHYLTADEAKGPKEGDPWFHDTLLCVQTRALKDDPLDKRMSLVHDWNNPHYYHLRTVEEMRKSLENVPESIGNSLIVAERCNAEIRTGRTFEMLPDFPVPEEYKTPTGQPDGMDEKIWRQQSYLREKIWEGLHRRYGSPLPAEVVERAEYELEVINKMGTTSYFLITWDWIRYAKEIGMVIGPGRGCFVPDTLVWTPSGYKRIADIEPGDQILDENGQLGTVRKRFDYDVDEELVKIKHYYGDSDGLTVTPDHKILVEKGGQIDKWTRCVKSRPSLERWQAPQGKLEWISAKDIEPGDLVAVAIPEITDERVPKWDLADYLPADERRRGYIEVTDAEIIRRTPLNTPYDFSQRDVARRHGINRPSIRRALTGVAGPRFNAKLESALREDGFAGIGEWQEYLDEEGFVESRTPRFVEANEDFCRLLGLMASDGWIRKERDCAGIAEHGSEPHIDPTVQELWSSVWGSDILGQYPHADSDLLQYESSHPVIAAFYRSLFCDYQYEATTKHLPDWSMELPEECRWALIDGLWMGDGSTNDRHKYSTSSPRLAYQVRTLLWSLGIPSSFSRDERSDDRPGFENRSISYSLVASRAFATSPPKQFGGRHEDYMLLRVYETSRERYKGKVHDLAVEDPNPPSYTTSSCVVHNSGAGSIVLYALDVTQLCPLEHKLLFERFLSPERISMPDVDTDAAPVGDASYDTVRQYLREKYGEENCAQIITFQTIGGKAGIRSAARAFGPELLPLADRMAKAVPMDGQVPVPLTQALEEGVELQQIVKGSSEAQKIIDSALWMEGLISAESVHAAAFVISPIPLTDALPVQLNKDGNPVTSFAMGEAESVGCLKLDLLGLRNLSILADAQRLIKKYQDVEVDAVNYQIPMDDEKTFEMLARGESVGVFQFESGGMADTLRAVGTTEFNDLVAIVAAYRPGAMEQIPLYARRKKGLEEVTYGDERMREILEETYGLILYQEQAMLLARDLAGFTGGLMDTLRKAIGKKLMDKMMELKPIFFNGTTVEKDGETIEVPGCLKNGVDKKTAEWVWSVFEASANYSFNKCLSADTRIRMVDGSRKRLSEVYKLQPEEIMSMWPDGSLRPHKVKRIVRTGNKPLFKVRTEGGRTIKLTQEHRLLTTEGYIPLSEMKIGTELITVPVYSEEERARRSEFMKELSQRPERKQQDARAAERMKAYQASRPMEDKVRHMKRMHELHPDMTKNAVKAMHERTAWLRENDPEWVRKHTESSLASVRAVYDTGPGFGRCSIASNGMWCASDNERAMCEWLIDCGIDFEMHKVLPNGRMSDFYFDGVHWEMDGTDRTHDFFEEKYGDMPFVVVTPEDYRAIVSKHLDLEHAENGDPIVSIEPVGNGSTFDIEMERGGPLNFIANNIVSHNSHAAAYALISYVTAYLKANYPVEYMAALLTSVMHTKDKVPFYLYETKRMGIEVLPPSVNESFSQFEPSGENAIRFGLTAVKGVGEGIVEGIVREREANGPFKSLWDFCQRVDGVNRRELDNLIKAGALDFTGESRMGMLEVTDQALKQAKKVRVKKAAGQDSLFDAVGGSAEEELAAMQMDTSPSIPKEEFEKMERFRLEREVTGLFVSGHPLDHARAAWERVRHLGVGEIGEEQLSDDADRPNSVTVAGIITGKRAVYTKRDNKRMLIIQLEDLTGNAEIVVFPKLVEQGMEEYLNEGDLAYLRVTIEEDTRGFGSDDDDTSRQIKLIAQHAGPFNPEVIEVSEYYDLKLPADVINENTMGVVMETLSRYPGQQAVRLMVLDADGEELERHVFPEEVRVSPSEGLRDALRDAVGA